MARPVWGPSRPYTLGTVLEPASKLMTMYEVTTAGTSGLSEPVWPDTPGATVVDGSVTWTCREAQTITWTCEPLYQTGATEPSWPTTPGATVVTGTVTLTARTAEVTDPNCPHSPVVLGIASKIFSPFKDVTRYSATNAARDWSTVDDAGFLPTGQNAPESVEVKELAEYRGRMAAFTSSHLQIWTVDPDPAEQSLFDSIPGIGTEYTGGAAGVAGDLFFPTRKGIKSLSIAAGATNLATTDVGTPIDSIVQVELAGPDAPQGLYYPAGGQFWQVFGDKAYVLSNSRLGKVGGWSLYQFPWAIDAHTQLDGDLYLRAGNSLYRAEETATDDGGVPFEGVVWWNYLDMGAPGASKMMHGFDVVGYGIAEVSFGYDQTNPAAYTAPFAIDPDTVPGGMVPMPLMAPSFALKLRYPPGQRWSLLAAAIYLDDLGAGV